MAGQNAPTYWDVDAQAVRDWETRRILDDYEGLCFFPAPHFCNFIAKVKTRDVGQRPHLEILYFGTTLDPKHPSTKEQHVNTTDVS